MIVHLVFVILAGLAINGHNSGGVESLDELIADTKTVYQEVKARDEFVSFKFND